MPTAHSLVAPTQKMSDDAAYPSSGSQAQPHGHSIPPQNSQSPYAQQPDARALTTRPAPGAPPAQNPYAGGYAPTQAPSGAQPHSIPPAPAQPRSIPPVNAPLGSTPPAGSSAPRQNSQPPRGHTTPAAGTSIPPAQRTSGPQVRRQTPAESVAAAAPAGRRWGLIIVVLLIDGGLATAGAWMLNEGLAEPAATSSTTTP